MTDNAARAIQTYCDAHSDEMLNTLARIVNIDSCSPNPRGVDEVAAVLREGLNQAGFTTERVPPRKSAGDQWLADFFVPEIGSFDLVADQLLGRKPGAGRGHAMLIGHMDTAFPFGEPERNPFRIEGQRALGCAINDMKGGLTVILYAVKALAKTGLKHPALTVVFDSDEQAGSITARALIEQIIHDEVVDWAFKAEAGLNGGKLRFRRPALGVALVEVEGVERHVGTAYWDGASAIIALAHKAIAIQALSDRERMRVVNVGTISGGTRRNLVAGHASARVDIRARTQSDWEELAQQVRAIAEAESVPGTRGSARIYNHRPAMEPTERTERLMSVVEGAGGELDQAVEYVEASAGSDANFAAALGVATLDGFGPAGANTMTRDEYIEVATLPQRAALLALTLHRLSLGN